MAAIGRRFPRTWAGPAAAPALAGPDPPRARRPGPRTGPGTDGADPADEGHPARWWILAVLAAVAFMAQLDLFIVNIALPVIGRQFGAASLAGLSWVLNAYAVVFAALLVPAGRLADHFGRRRFLLAGVAVFTVASAACAAAPALGVLVAARAVQAVGAAMIVPTSLGLLYPAFSPPSARAGGRLLGRRWPPWPGRRGRRWAGCWRAWTGAGFS